MRTSERTVRVAVDVALAALFTAVLAVTAYALAISWGGSSWVFGLVAGLVVCLLALLRHRAAAWTAVAGLGVALLAVVVGQVAGLPREPAPATTLALATLVASAVRHLPTRWAAGIAGGDLVVVVAAWLTGGFTGVATLATAGWLAALAVGLGLRLADLRRQTSVERVRRDERLQLAGELHDEVAHHVTGIVLQAQAAQVIAEQRPEAVGGSLAGIEAAGSNALAGMRRVVGLLRDPNDAAPTAPGPEQLTDLVARFRQHGFAVRLQVPDDDATATWPTELANTVYRVVQESLTNVARHAPQAGTVTVDVAQDQREVTVVVTDDAPPASVRYPHRGGYGLLGMRERVEALGGILHAGPRPTGGWSVHATLPRTLR